MEKIDLQELLKDFIANLKLSLKKFGPWLKQTLKLPYAKTYIASALGLTLLFTLLMFPFDSIIRNKLLNMSGPGRTVYSITIPADENGDKMVDYSLFGTSVFKQFEVYFKPDEWLKFYEMQISDLIGPGGLYDIRYNDKFSGTIETTRLEYQTPKVYLKCNLNTTFDLGFIKAGKAVVSTPKKDKRPKLKPRKSLDEGSVDITATKIQLAIKNNNTLDMINSIVTLPETFKFDTLRLNVSIAKKKVTIKKALISGKELSGKISGSIKLQDIVGNSQLDLTITINKDSKIIKDNMDKLQAVLQSLLDAKGNIKIKLKGTLARPKPDIKGGMFGGDTDNGPMGPMHKNPGPGPEHI